MTTASRVHLRSWVKPLPAKHGGSLLAAGFAIVAFADWLLWRDAGMVPASLLVLGSLLLVASEIVRPSLPGDLVSWSAGYSKLADHPIDRSVILLGAVYINLMTDLLIFSLHTATMIDWSLVAGWFLSILLLLAAALPVPTHAVVQRLAQVRTSTFWRNVLRNEAGWVALILLLAAATRLLDPAFLYPVRGDEAYQRDMAHLFVPSTIPDLFSIDSYDNPRMYFVPMQLFMAAFGSGLTPARIYVALWGTAAIVPAYFLLRELFSPLAAVVAALLLAVEPLHVDYSRQNLPQVFTVFWVALALYCLVRGLRTGHRGWWIAAGIATGVAQYGHTDGRFLVIIIVACLLYEALREPRQLWDQRWNIAWLAIAAVMTYGPTLLYGMRTPSVFIGRSTQESILSSGWLAQQSRSVGLVTVLAQQARDNIMPLLTATPSTDLFFRGGAILPPFAVPFAVAGLARCATRPLHRGTFLLLFWALLTFVAGGILVVPLFGSQHLIELTIPLALLVSLGAIWLSELWPARRWMVALLVASFLVGDGLYYFFVQYPPIGVQDESPYYQGTTMTEIGYFVRGVRPDAHVYVFDTSIVDYYGVPAAPWLAGDRTDVVDIVQRAAVPPLTRGPSGAVFLFLPVRLGALTAVRRQFPGGRLTALRTSHLPGRTLAVAYLVGHPLRGPG